MNGQAEIAAMMEGYRTSPPQTLGGNKVTQLLDYQKQIATDLASGNTTAIQLPKSNVLQFVLEDGSKISARPSGTEPKIKFYFSVKAPLATSSEYKTIESNLLEKINRITTDLSL